MGVPVTQDSDFVHLNAWIASRVSTYQRLSPEETYQEFLDDFEGWDEKRFKAAGKDFT